MPLVAKSEKQLQATSAQQSADWRCTLTSGRRRENTLSVGSLAIEILPFIGVVKHLGVQLCFDEPQQQILIHRIRCAWAAFQAHKQELTSKAYRLADRLKLFEIGGLTNIPI